VAGAEALGTVVVGGGVTGLAAAMATGATVLEAAADPGGICSSYYVRPGSTERLARRPDDGDAYRFEVGGGHWIFGGDPDVLDLIGSLAPMEEHERRAEVHFASTGAGVPYPFQDHVGSLDPALAERAAVEPRPALPADRPPTMAEWLRHRFGATLCERFFDPFHERYTAGLYPELAPQDAYKTPQGSTGPKGYNVTFRYPSAGLDVVARAMAGRSTVRYDHRVVGIDPEARTIEVAGRGSIAYERLICTLPLDTTLDLCRVDPTRTGPADPATSVLVVNIGGERGAACPDSHWVYEPEASAGFHRYGVYSNVDPSFVPVGRRDRVALYVEHARRRGDRPDPAAEAALVAATVDELVARDVVRSVEVVDVSWVPTAYTWSVPGSTWAADALDVLAELGVEQVGRYARWHFQGIAESIAEGLAVGLAQ
jgi:protoporphyrinogen oxidase